MEINRIPAKVLHMNLETRLRGRPRNRWQDEVREDGRPVDGKGWKERVYNRQEWKKPLRMKRNHCILHMPVERMNEMRKFYETNKHFALTMIPLFMVRLLCLLNHKVKTRTHILHNLLTLLSI